MDFQDQEKEMIDSEDKLNIEKEKLKKYREENYAKDKEISTLKKSLKLNK